MSRCGHVKEALEATEYAGEKTLGLEDIQVLSKTVIMFPSFSVLRNAQTTLLY